MTYRSASISQWCTYNWLASPATAGSKLQLPVARLVVCHWNQWFLPVFFTAILSHSKSRCTQVLLLWNPKRVCLKIWSQLKLSVVRETYLLDALITMAALLDAGAGNQMAFQMQGLSKWSLTKRCIFASSKAISHPKTVPDRSVTASLVGINKKIFYKKIWLKTFICLIICKWRRSKKWKKSMSLETRLWPIGFRFAITSEQIELGNDIKKKINGLKSLYQKWWFFFFSQVKNHEIFELISFLKKIRFDSNKNRSQRAIWNWFYIFSLPKKL